MKAGCREFWKAVVFLGKWWGDNGGWLRPSPLLYQRGIKLLRLGCDDQIFLVIAAVHDDRIIGLRGIDGGLNRGEGSGAIGGGSPSI